jgi:hypothetical protein
MIQLKASAGMLNSMGTDFWSEPEKCAAEAHPATIINSKKVLTHSAQKIVLTRHLREKSNARLMVFN